MTNKRTTLFNVVMLILYFITKSYIPLILALLLSLIYTISEKTAERFFRTTDKFISAAGNALFVFALAAVFYFIITPLGLLRRTKKLIFKKHEGYKYSYYDEVNKTFSLQDLEKQY